MEKHLLITSAKYEVTDGGIACGPVPGSVIAEAGFKKPDGEEFFIVCAEVMGIPNFYKSDRSTFDEHVAMDNAREEFDEDIQDYLMSCYIDGIGEYDEIFENKDIVFKDYVKRIEHNDKKIFNGNSYNGYYCICSYRMFLKGGEKDYCECKRRNCS